MHSCLRFKVGGIEYEDICYEIVLALKWEECNEIVRTL